MREPLSLEEQRLLAATQRMQVLLQTLANTKQGSAEFEAAIIELELLQRATQAVHKSVVAAMACSDRLIHHMSFLLLTCCIHLLRPFNFIWRLGFQRWM